MFLYIRRVLEHNKQEGATAVEYGLLVAAIAAVIVGVVFVLGHYVKGAFNDTCQSIAHKGSTSGASGDCTK
jgi:pilus assembly protein Flp/PilA